jgi:LCP family protein required for cell wall assembly
MKKVSQPRFYHWFYYFFVIAGVVWTTFYFLPDRFKPESMRSHPPARKVPTSITVLMFGIDADEDTKRSDSVIVARLDVRKRYLGVISIPRDTYVFVDGQGYTKLNHAYMVGDNRLLIKTVSEYLNVPIDFVVKFGLTGVVRFVDAIGGVDVTVPKDMSYDDNAGNLHIHIKKGYQKLDGQQALNYLRFRHDDAADIGRIKRQQEFLKTVINQLMAKYSPQKVYELLISLAEYVYFDFSMSDVVMYFPHLVTIVESGNVHMDVMPGVPEKKNGVYYWVTKEEDVTRIVRDTLYGGNTELAPERLDY